MRRLAEAIPPYYAEYVGRQLMDAIHAFKPYADMPEYCVAELPSNGDTCNRPAEDHAR